MSCFSLKARDGKARAGLIKTLHGDIPTPIFMPVGTRGTVKSLWQEELRELGAHIVLANTYHLYLRPGHELVEEVAGGLHGFMNWPRPLLTDSGGFQIFSLAHLNRVTEKGVEFRSHIDGSLHFIDPEKSMEIQRALGSDIVMMFDDCPRLPASRESLRQSLELTLNWAKRCAAIPLKEHQHLFGIVQGGLELDLRLECLERLEALEPSPAGLALGGLSVGEKNHEMRALLEDLAHRLPPHKPRYLMGVGTPTDILHAISCGVDMFDCVLPTRNARNGQALTSQGPLNIKNERFAKDPGPLDPQCPCKVCTRYSRAYIRHLTTVGEYLAGQMLSHHNLFFYLDLVGRARKAITCGEFDEFAKNFYNTYTQGKVG
ncbi:MAG: tRNA guanosine(34) transglycosylase Tgt [Bacteriovoracales bacterium]|nr:tRNA guanosine(34) transglycosylase Tgt [Bacteriovoracales bacterium]